MFFLAGALALVGWAVVYLASSRPASASRLRRLLNAAYDRWLKTPEWLSRGRGCVLMQAAFPVAASRKTSQRAPVARYTATRAKSP